MKSYLYLCITLQDKDIFIEHRKILKKIFDSLKKVSYFCKTIDNNRNQISLSEIME